MKHKIITLMLALSLTFSITACGGTETEAPAETPATVEIETTVAETEVAEDVVEPEEVVEDDGIINFDGEGYNITYVKHELSEDYEGNPCLLFYYTFTNNSEENASAAFTTYIKVFQNGIQCDSAILMDSPDSAENYLKEIQPGITLEVCQAFELEDTSNVTVEASELASFDDKKDVQILVLE